MCSKSGLQKVSLFAKFAKLLFFHRLNLDQEVAGLYTQGTLLFRHDALQ